MTDGGLRTDDVQQTLDGDEHPAHLTKNPTHADVHNTDWDPGNLTSREYWCVDCGKRVTQELNGDGEYGHKDCEHSIRHRDDHSLSPMGDA